MRVRGNSIDYYHPQYLRFYYIHVYRVAQLETGKGEIFKAYCPTRYIHSTV